MAEYEAAITSAAELSDAHDALRLVNRSAKGFGGGGPSDELPRPPSRRCQKLLAGILLRAGQAEAGGRVLTFGISPDRVPQADAIIVDPGFVGLSGHHFNANVFYKRMIERHGLSVSVARSIIRTPVLQGDSTGSVGAFSLTPYHTGLRPPPLTQDLLAVNDLFFHELQRGLPDEGVRLIVAHSLRHTFAEGLSRYLQSVCGRGPVSVLLGILEIVDPSSHPDSAAIRMIYTRAFGRLRSIANLRLMVTAETAELADFARDVAGPEPEIMVLPYAAGLLDAIEVPHQAHRAPGLTVGYVGQSRPERGAHLIPEIAEATLAAGPTALVWRAQIALGKDAPECATVSLQRLARHPRFERFEAHLSREAYRTLLSSIDIMVLPYDDRYEVSGSGVAFESLRAGCVQVVPERSSMAALARANGAGFVTFPDPTREQVTAAIVEAVERFAELSQRSREAAEAARRDRSHYLKLERFFQAV